MTQLNDREAPKWDEYQPAGKQADPYIGTVANGYVWTGETWAPLQGVPQAYTHRPSTSAQQSGPSPVRITVAVFSLLVAAFFGYLGFSWFGGYSDLEAQGNDFAGLLAVFGLGAWAVAAAFGITGIVLFTRR